MFSYKVSGLAANTKHYGKTDVSEFIINEKRSEQEKHQEKEKNQEQEEHQEHERYTRINTKCKQRETKT